jgi:subtilisin family serine protease
MLKLRPHLLAALFVALLPGCGGLSGGPSDGSNLNMGTLELAGVLTATIEVNTSDTWQAKASSSWITLSPASGDGNATIQVTVDPSNLVPGRHNSSVTVDFAGDASSQVTTILFAFPKLRGSIVMGPAPTSTADSPSLLSAQSLSTGPGRLLVGLREPVGGGPLTASDFRSLAAGIVAERSGVDLLTTLPHSRLAVVKARNAQAAAESLRGDPDVRYVEPDVVLEPLLTNDEFSLEQWSLPVIGAEQAWALGTGLGVTIAIIDTGFDPDHVDLQINVAGSHDAVKVDGQFTVLPACGTHGEHVAGIVAAEANNIVGVAGIAPDASLLLVNVGTDAAGCPMYTSDIVKALDWITNAPFSPRADIVNMSIGGSPTISLQEAVENAYAAGVMLVAAAGNSATASVLYPAAYPQVLAVSATGRFNEIASYSTTGPEIFLSAPGGNGDYSILNTIIRSDGSHYYGYMQGTSMASPAVAAVAALVKSVNPALTPVGIAGILADSSVDLGDTGRDDTFGYGRIDAEAAVTRADSLVGQPTGYRLVGPGWEYPIPAAENFEAGYVGGTITLKAGSDDDWDGTLKESGEYYGEITTEVTFEGEYFVAKPIPVEKVPAL